MNNALITNSSISALRLILIYLISFTNLAAAKVALPGLEQVAVVDDIGETVRVERPVRRIVSLAPHLTEMLFSLGMGDKIVGTVRYSDYPAEAKNIPRLGDAFSLNVEAVLAMQADIIFAWHTGGVNPTVQRLKALGIPVFTNDSRSLRDISKGLVRMALIVGKEALGIKLQNSFDESLKQLRVVPQFRPVVFFQISEQDLYSVSDRHIIGESIRHCGGSNLFADLRPDVTTVSNEAVVAGRPDLILITQSPTGPSSPWLEKWRSYEYFQNRVSTIDPNLISRPSLRMLEGVRRICTHISKARLAP